jgi:tetratricopeptide (TPR) repeat protein
VSSAPISSGAQRKWLVVGLLAVLAIVIFAIWRLTRTDIKPFQDAVNRGSLVSPSGSSAWDLYEREVSAHGTSSDTARKMNELARPALQSFVDGSFNRWHTDATVDAQWTDLARAAEWMAVIEPNNPSNEARQLYALGQAAFERGNYPEARNYYQNALARSPGWDLALSGVGKTYVRQRNYNEAENYYNQAAAASPNWTFPLQNLAEMYIGLTDKSHDMLPKAEGVIRRAVAIEPNRAGPHEILGRVLYFEKSFPGACQELQRALDLAPSAGKPVFSPTRVRKMRDTACAKASRGN